MDHGLHQRDIAVGGQSGEARTDHRLAQNLPVLLGPVTAGAQPAAGCHDDRCDHA
jgi:hypothetical protein